MESGTVPKHKLGSFPGSWELVPSDLQVLNRWLPFQLVLRGPGEGVLQKERLPTSDLNFKGTRFLAYFARQMEKTM